MRCFTCETTDLSEGAFHIGLGAMQTVGCLGCAVKYEKQGIPCELIPTAEQTTELARWRAAGIGTN